MSLRFNKKYFLIIIKYEIWKKIEDLLNINFESRPIYGDNDK